MLKLLVLVSSAVAFRPLVAPSRAVCMRATPDLDDFDVRAPSVACLCSASGSRRDTRASPMRSRRRIESGTRACLSSGCSASSPGRARAFLPAAREDATRRVRDARDARRRPSRPARPPATWSRRTTRNSRARRPTSSTTCSTSARSPRAASSPRSASTSTSAPTAASTRPEMSSAKGRHRDTAPRSLRRTRGASRVAPASRYSLIVLSRTAAREGDPSCRGSGARRGARIRGEGASSTARGRTPLQFGSAIDVKLPSKCRGLPRADGHHNDPRRGIGASGRS